MSRTTITVQDVEFAVSAKLVATGVPFPDDDMKQGEKHLYHNKFRIYLKTALGRTSFDFYGSHADWEAKIKEMPVDDLKHALYCFVSDACSGMNSFEDFCKEFGYDEDSRRAERIHKACERSLAKFQRICEADIYEVVNALND